VKYKLKDKVGSHVHHEDGGKPFDINPGDIVETDAPLKEMFPDKFELVEGLPDTPPVPDPDDEDTPLVPPKDQPPVKERAKKKPAEKKPTKKSTSKPKDVTDKFSHAKEEDFVVFAHKRGYWVAEADDLDTILNDKKLKKGEVDAFIDTYLKG